MKERTKAYMAGLMDAEGCFTIAPGKTKYGTQRYEPCLSLTNNHRGLAEWIVGQFGGSCYWKKVYATNKLPWYQWKSTSFKHAQSFLSDVLPYLTIKKEEAKILNQFYDLYRQECPEIRRELWHRITALKNRNSVTTNTPDFPTRQNILNAYVAGFFDGEGTVGIMENGKGSIRSRIQISNTSKPILNFIAKQYGGSIYSRGRRQPQHQPIWTWQLDRQHQQELFILKVLPYLIIKNDKAKQSLNWIREKR